MPPNLYSKACWRQTMDKLNIVKIGGSILDQEVVLQKFIKDFSSLEGPKILVHGGGTQASSLSEKLGIKVKMKDGRRITDTESLDVAVMVYAGLINKTLVAKLQANKCNAVGLSGADLSVIPAKKREHPNIDYGWVGDIEPRAINGHFLKRLMEEDAVPVFCAITHDTQGQLLNTNADTIARRLAETFSSQFQTSLTICMNIEGVLQNATDPDSLLATLSFSEFQNLRASGAVTDGMIPKLHNGFKALEKGAAQVMIKHPSNLLTGTGTILEL